MASPDFLAACCVTNISNTILNEDEDLFVVGHVMIVVTVVMCVVSLLGVFYLLLPRGQPGTEWMRNSNRILTGPSLNSIIKCVIATNVLATLGKNSYAKHEVQKCILHFLLQEQNHYDIYIYNDLHNLQMGTGIDLNMLAEDVYMYTLYMQLACVL